MKRLVSTLVLATVLGAAGAASAAAAPGAPGVPNRPAGPVVPIAPSDNGGDNGWGNCGRNSSGGHPPVSGGNGGYRKGDCLGTPPGGGEVEPPGDGGGEPGAI